MGCSRHWFGVASGHGRHPAVVRTRHAHFSLQPAQSTSAPVSGRRTTPGRKPCVPSRGAGTGAVGEADFLAAPAPQNISGSAAGGRTFIGNTFYSSGATVPLPTLD
jgi:hypothetical protein